MTAVLNLSIRIYALLLNLYPKTFRNEFAEQMLLDFADLAAEASRKGSFSFFWFCLHELVDFPLNVLRIHYQEGPLFRLLGSEPIKHGLRGALGLGIGFAAITSIEFWISRWLFSVFDPLIQTYSIWYWDTFRNERWIGLLQNSVLLFSFALTALCFGLMFALLAGKRGMRLRYLLVGSYAWFIPNVVRNIMFGNFGWSFYLSEAQSRALSLSISVLVGVFWGAAILFAGSDRKIASRYLAGVAVGYPLATYLVIRLLFSVWLEITPWFFISLMVFVMVLIASVIVAALWADRKALWTVLAGAIGFPILRRAAIYIAFTLLQFPTAPLGVPLSPGDVRLYQMSDMAFQAIFGMLLGLIVGLSFGYQRQRAEPQLSA